MNHIKKISWALLSLLILTTSLIAEMPEALKGSWVLDAEATGKYLKTSPKWDEAGEKHMPMILKRMSQMLYEFEEGQISISMRGKKRSFPVTIKESDPKKCTLETQLNGKSMTMTVFFRDDATINIRSGSSDDMDYYLWKRGSLSEKVGPSDKALALEVMKKAVEKAPKKIKTDKKK